VSNKRILQLIGDLNPGGAERLVVSLARALKDNKYHVVICSREMGSLMQNIKDISTVVLPKRKLIDPKYILSLCRSVREQRINLIHSHLFGNDLYGFWVSVLTGKKAILTIHGEDSFRSKRRRLFYKLVAPFVFRIVAVSKPLYTRLKEDLCIDERKISLITCIAALRRMSYPLTGFIFPIAPTRGVSKGRPSFLFWLIRSVLLSKSDVSIPLGIREIFLSSMHKSSLSLVYKGFETATILNTNGATSL